jgi:alkylglycerol monooxygenase
LNRLFTRGGALRLLFVAIDGLYYFGHRLSHSSTFVWSGHYVHHSSEYYNFTTAIRQGVFEAALLWPRHLVFALLGFPPVYWLVWNEINFGMMFFVHTEQIGKLWWPIEFIFNTPSHHRVHHARNPLYIDKNYGGIFIFWDRLFGTFEEEKEKCVYGLVHPIHYVDPLQMQFAHLRSVLSRCRVGQVAVDNGRQSCLWAGLVLGRQRASVARARPAVGGARPIGRIGGRL